jgi:signal transduction histidine kinase
LRKLRHNIILHDHFADIGTGSSAESMREINRLSFTAKTKKGMSLGLSNCDRFVKAHGGTIGVRSENGRGSTFCLQSPLTGAGSR